MSRIGYKLIEIPTEVTVSIQDGGDFGYKIVRVVGPKGELSVSLRRGVTPKIESNILSFERSSETKQMKSYHGLYRSLIGNMIDGVSKGFKKELEIIGIGYRAEQVGTKVVFSLGYSHKIELMPPAGIQISIVDQTKVTVEGADKQKVGEIAAKIRAFREPEPYKGKGVRYLGEQVRRKSSKSASA